MNLSRRKAALAAGICCLMFAAGGAWADSSSAPPVAGPWIGTWKYNAVKSAAANNEPAPTAQQIKGSSRVFKMIEAREDVFKYTLGSMSRDGELAVSAELIGRFDGKDYIELGNPGADTNKFKIVDDHTYELVDTKDGKDVRKFRVTVSPDGQTRTSVWWSLDNPGAKRVSVYDRVK